MPMSTPQRSWTITAVLAVAGILIVLYGIGRSYVHEGPSVPAALAPFALDKEPAPAPLLAVSDAKGARHAISDFRGHYLLVNLWASWCAPCVRELSSLAALSHSVPGLKVVAVDVGRDRAEEAGVFLKSHGAGGLIVYLDTDAALLRGFRAPGLPLSVLIDPKGREVGRALGAVDWNSKAGLAYFRALTGAPAAS